MRTQHGRKRKERLFRAGFGRFSWLRFGRKSAHIATRPERSGCKDRGSALGRIPIPQLGQVPLCPFVPVQCHIYDRMGFELHQVLAALSYGDESLSIRRRLKEGTSLSAGDIVPWACKFAGGHWWGRRQTRAGRTRRLALGFCEPETTRAALLTHSHTTIERKVR